MNISENIKRALQNKRSILVGNAEQRDEFSDKSIKQIESAARASIALFSKERGGSLFLDRAPRESGEMTQEFAHIKRIAISYATKGSEHFEKEEILDMLLYSLEWMYNNRYGENEILGKGWRDMRLFNWWDWEIGSPTSLIDALVILEDKIDVEKRKKYLSVFDKRVPLPRDYSSNKMHYAELCTLAGLLENDADRIYAALEESKDTYEFADGWKNDGQGFYTDGSYIFHTRHPMNGTYGIAHFRATIDLCRVLKGTCFANAALEEKLLYWAENSFLPFVSRCYAARGIMGRHPHDLLGAGLAMLSGVCDAASLMMDENREKCEYIFDLVARNILGNREMCAGERITGFLASLKRDARVYLKSAIERARASEPCEYNLTKVFHNQDRAVHHFGEVAYSLSMSSSRIYNYECINNENMRGWYLGDGMLTCLGSDSDAYKDMWVDIDPYKLPCTTLDSREREVISISQRNEYLSSKDFVGGAEADGTLTAAMILESYHGDGEHIDKTYYVEGGAHGGPPAKRDCTLIAKKAYFINGRIAVMLGAGISANDGADVYTVVDSRKSKRRVREISENALYLDGFGGYLILEGEKILSRGGNDLFEEIIINHKKNPEGEKYAFAYLPEYSEEEVMGFSNKPPFVIKANTESLKALEFEDGTRSFVFYERGTFEDISVSEPLIIMIKKGRAYLADPTQKLDSVRVKVGDKEYSLDLKDLYGKTLSFDI